MQLFVLGMHRSGTSGVTRLLNMAGAYFGPEGISNGADEGNPKGFWERVDVRAACDGILQSAGFDWWRLSTFSLDAVTEDARAPYVAEFRKIILELDAHRPWVLKEPRLCLLFPLLRPLLEVPVCIHVTREPLEVAESLQVRNGFPAPAGLALWELYTIHAFRASAGLPRILVRYEDLIASPVATVEKLVSRLHDVGVEGLRMPTEREINAYISPELHRQRRASDARGAWLNEQQRRLAADAESGTLLADDTVLPEVSEGAHAALHAFEEDRARQARGDELEHLVRELQKNVETLNARIESSQRRVEALSARIETAKGRIDKLEAERTRVRGELRRARASLASVERHVRTIASSRSWRLASRIVRLRRRLSPGRSRRDEDALQILRAQLQEVRSNLAEPLRGEPGNASDQPGT